MMSNIPLTVPTNWQELPPSCTLLGNAGSLIWRSLPQTLGIKCSKKMFPWGVSESRYWHISETGQTQLLNEHFQNGRPMLEVRFWTWIWAMFSRTGSAWERLGHLLAMHHLGNHAVHGMSGSKHQACHQQSVTHLALTDAMHKHSQYVSTQPPCNHPGPDSESENWKKGISISNRDLTSLISICEWSLSVKPVSSCLQELEKKLPYWKWPYIYYRKLDVDFENRSHTEDRDLQCNGVNDLAHQYAHT